MHRYFIFIAKEEVDKPLESRIEVLYNKKNQTFTHASHDKLEKLYINKLTPCVAEIVSETNAIDVNSNNKFFSFSSAHVNNPKIIEIHDLFSYKTVEAFELKELSYALVRYAYMYNRIDFLQEMNETNNNFAYKYAQLFEENAIKYGNISALDWCRKNNYNKLFTADYVYTVIIGKNNYMEYFKWYNENGYTNIIFSDNLYTRQNEMDNIMQQIITHVLGKGNFDLLELFYENDFGMDFKNFVRRYINTHHTVFYPYFTNFATSNTENIMKFLNWIEKTNNVKFLNNKVFARAIIANDLRVMKWCHSMKFEIELPLSFSIDFTKPDAGAIANWIKENYNDHQTQCISVTYLMSKNNNAHIVPAVVPEAIPAVVPETIPAVVPETIPAVVPEAIPAVVPEAIPTGIPEAVSEAVATDATWWKWVFG
jgi:hypothetical protein